MKNLRLGIASLAALFFATGAVFAQDDQRGYYDAPYYRYEAEMAAKGGNAILNGPNLDQKKLEAQASNMQYVGLPSTGAYVEWTVRESEGGAGLNMRFTMPDRPDGWGDYDHWTDPAHWTREEVLTGSLDVYVNGEKRTINQYGKISDKIPLSSYWAWQYFGDGSDQPQDKPAPDLVFKRFAFDEVHFILEGEKLKAGDVVRIQNNDGLYDYGVDFIEIEELPAMVEKPADAYSVADYGNGKNRAAIDACFAAAKRDRKGIYFPPGVYEYYTASQANNIWYLSATQGMKITGAGMWYTNLHFPSSRPSGGGVSGENGAGNQSANIEFSNMYLSSMLRSRHYQQAIYKGFMEGWGKGSHFHDLWIEHFECGFWIGDYNPPFIGTEDLVIEKCRIRNNLADGVNFCVGTQNSKVTHCSVRGNGDDALAMWNNSGFADRDQINNEFSYNTIENNWRAGGIAIFGGDLISVNNNYIIDCFKGAGIRLNTTFDGYKFTNTTNISFKNNTIVNCGTSWDCYNGERGAVDLAGEVRNITFENTEICNSHRCAIQFAEGTQQGIKFINTKVNTVALDGGTSSKFTWGEDIGKGRVVFINGGTAPTFDGMLVRNVAAKDLVNLQESTNKNSTWVTPPVYETWTEGDCICEQEAPVPSPVPSIVADNGSGKFVKAYGTTVEASGLEAGDVISVFNTIGIKVRTQKAVQEKEFFVLPKPGLYIITIDGKTRTSEKVLIQ